MSTKCTEVLVDFGKETEIHIYYECIDGSHYIETKDGRLRIRTDYAHLLAGSLREISDIQDKEFERTLRKSQ